MPNIPPDNREYNNALDILSFIKYLSDVGPNPIDLYFIFFSLKKIFMVLFQRFVLPEEKVSTVLYIIS